ncbi:MAG: RNase adapter RapZ [Nitrospirota bacterium]
MEHRKIEVVVVSGLSGAGKTVALRALEDIGYFCIDNLPVTLIDPFLSTVKAGESIRKIGIGVDVREKFFLADVYRILSRLKEQYLVEILFLEAEKQVMVRRYKETRRPHPMVAMGRAAGIDEAIGEEVSLLAGMREAADKIIDTSNYTPHQLRHLIISTHGDVQAALGMTISMISFGFKFGVPADIDLLFDVRFLPNPYFVPELKPLKGTDREVADFVLRRDETKEFLDRLAGLLDFLLPHYIKEGRSYLVIGVGCTGGRHRSPAVVEKIAEQIKLRHGLEPSVTHRDIGV